MGRHAQSESVTMAGHLAPAAECSIESSKKIHVSIEEPKMRWNIYTMACGACEAQAETVCIKWIKDRENLEWREDNESLLCARLYQVLGLTT